MKGFVPISIAIIFSAWTTDRVFAADAVVEPHTEAAVLAADDDWLAAELRGDPKALDARLMPTYRDVSLEGRTRTMQDVLASAAKHPNKVTTAPLQAAADYRAQHPIGEGSDVGPTFALDSGPVVTVASGRLQGVSLDSGGVVFRGIPDAQPPIGGKD